MKFKIKEIIKKLFRPLDEIRESIKDLENRTFKKQSLENMRSGVLSWYLGVYNTKSLEEEIEDLQEKVEALEKYLKVEVKHEETDEWVARKVRKKK